MQEKIIWWIRCLGTKMAYGGNRQLKKDKVSLFIRNIGCRIHAYGWRLSFQHTINHFGYQDWTCCISGEDLEKMLKNKEKLSNKELKLMRELIFYESIQNGKSLFWKLLTL